MPEIPVIPPSVVAARVAEIIRSHPEAYWQRAWWDAPGRDEGAEVPVSSFLAALDAEHPCGTTCCAAGWAVVVASPAGTVLDDDLVSYPDGDLERIDRAAAKALGIPWPEGLGSFETLPLFESGRTRDEVLAELDRIAAGGDPQEPKQ